MSITVLAPIPPAPAADAPAALISMEQVCKTYATGTIRVDALTDMLLGLAAISTHGQPLLYLDYMRNNLDAMLDRYEMEDE